MSQEPLPAGWSRARLRDLVPKPRPKIPADPNSTLPFIGMDHIEANSFHLTGQAKFSAMKSTGSYFEEGDVLYGRLRPYLNKVHRARFDGVASAEFIVLPATPHFESDFLKLLVHQKSFVDFAMSKASGDRPRVKFAGIAEFEFGLPPLREQRRIVEKVETLFAELDKGEESLRQVRTLLARYRLSVLKAAVTDSDGSSEKVRLGELLEDIRYGTAKKCHAESEGVPVLRIPNVVTGQIDLEDLKFAELDEKEISRLRLSRGDVLLVRSNGSANLVGRTAVIDDRAVGMAFAGYLIRLRVDQDRLLPDFLHIVLNSPEVRAKIERQARSTSGVHNINSTEVRAIEFDLPPVAKQSEIVGQVGEQVANAELLEAACTAELSRSNALRQSILKVAFSGRLVPQDPNDEPASKLLARIRAARDDRKKK